MIFKTILFIFTILKEKMRVTCAILIFNVFDLLLPRMCVLPYFEISLFFTLLFSNKSVNVLVARKLGKTCKHIN